MLHNPSFIITQARELIAHYGQQAEEVAKQRMYEKMEQEDVSEASLWMAVIHEIRNIGASSDTLH